LAVPAEFSIRRENMLEKLPESLGLALRGQRAGLEKIVINKFGLRCESTGLTLSSPAFASHTAIPPRYTADGDSISPPLHWYGIPKAAASLALIVEDADSPTPEPLVHAIAVDIARDIKGLLEGQLREGPVGSANLGRNSYLRQAWLPPDPPPGHGIHRYAFQLFALKDGSAFSATPGRQEFAAIVRDRMVACGCLIGTYERIRRA
jgi:Raf kinase inhibitor-like YbhB/YbcL family protein